MRIVCSNYEAWLAVLGLGTSLMVGCVGPQQQQLGVANTLGESTAGAGDTDTDDDRDSESSDGGSDSSDPSGGTTGSDDPTGAATSGMEPPDTDGGDGSTGELGEDREAPDLLQAAYNPDTETYEFGFGSIDTLPITGSPSDVDWSRWGMLHDGSSYRLYAMKAGSDDTLYAFEYDTDAQQYQGSTQGVAITDAPANADLSSFAMVHDGVRARLYALSDDTNTLHQFGFDEDAGAFVYGHSSIPEIPIANVPGGTDWTGWAMVHDGTRFRLYAYGSTAHDSIVQFAYDSDVEAYVEGFESISPLDLQAIPSNGDQKQFAMLHDGDRFRLYLQATP
jgi:hypothetical protein